MEKSFCKVLLEYHPGISEYEDLHSTFISNCVFNSFLCYTAIMLNIVTIYAIRKTSSLPKTLKTLLLSLAVSDVGVGLLVQPLNISLQVRWIQQNRAGCSTYKVIYIITYFFLTASFFGVVAVSVDRFLAIHLHLRYQELVTHKRVVAVVISVWVISVFVSLLMLWVPLDIYFRIISIIGVVGFVLTTLVYIRIYIAVLCHKNQIQALQVQQVAQSDEMSHFASLVKSAVGIFYVYLVFLVCYLPFFIWFVSIKINGPSIALKRFFLFSVTLFYLNSSLNPVIYCWKMRHIRHAIMDILRNMPWHRNRALQ
ncbi:adenosine receptor A2a-like [Oculina patagonica]